MSKMKIATIVCWIVTAAAMVGLAIYFITRGVFSFGGFNSGNTETLSGSYDEDGSYSVPVDQISNITIDWITGEIEVNVYDGNDIKITEYAQRELKDEEVLHQFIKNDTLEIRYTEKNQFYNLPSKKLVVNIPLALAKELGDVKFESISADIYIQNIQASLVQVSTTSGKTTMGEVIASQINYSSISGSAILTNVTADTINHNASSGELSVIDGKIQSVLASTISGPINITGSLISLLDADTTSGTVTLESSVLTERINANTISADVIIKIPKADTIAVEYDTISGNLDSNVPITSGQGNPAISVSTTSGNLRISDYNE